MHKFETFKDAAGEFRWRLKAGNGQVVAVPGEGYKTQQGCLDAIHRFQDEVRLAPVEELTAEAFGAEAGMDAEQIKARLLLVADILVKVKEMLPRLEPVVGKVMAEAKQLVESGDADKIEQMARKLADNPFLLKAIDLVI